ncbi:MAG: TetR family transcriptional regulator [Propionivibrio sp.]
MVRKTKEEALETRNAILNAAEVVFQERGVSQTSLGEIAAAAGVTRGAIYWHFKNKEDLFNAMIERIVGAVEIKLAELQARNYENPVRLIRDLSCYYIDRVANDPRYLKIVDISWHKCEYVGEMAGIRDTHMECGNRYHALSVECFAKAQERGLLRPDIDPCVAAVGLIAIVDGLVANWALDQSMFPLASYGPAIIDTYLAGLGLDFADEKGR